MKQKRLDKLLEGNLYEQPEEQEPEEEHEADSESGAEADKEVSDKEIGDIEKDDLDNDEEEYEEGDIAASIKLNDNDKVGGDIKLVSYKKLESLNSIESILELFKIDPDTVSPAFKDRIEVTINSPLDDFKEELYKISLMDKYGEISVNRPDLKTTISKKSKTPMGQAVQQAVGDEEGQEVEQQETIDLSYLPELNIVFRNTIKNEFFDRILNKR